MHERRKDGVRRRRFDEERAALMLRLRRVAGRLPGEELERLASRMTRVKLKYERLIALPEPD